MWHEKPAVREALRALVAAIVALVVALLQGCAGLPVMEVGPTAVVGPAAPIVVVVPQPEPSESKSLTQALQGS